MATKTKNADKASKKGAAAQNPTKATAKNAQTENNKAEVAKAITDKKDLKYIYPKGCTQLGQRKKFRHQTRAKIKQFENAIAKLVEGTDKKALKAKEIEMEAFLAEVRVPGTF